MEIIIEVKKGHRQGCESLLRDAIERVNEKVQLNTKLDIDVQFGDDYSQIH